jgi:ribonuclease HI
MPWKKMRLRGDDVFARVDDSGALVADSGRVEIRYRAGASKPYRASARNLEPASDTTVFPDAHCSDETATAPAEKPAHSKRAEAKPTKASHASMTDEVIVYADGACTGNPGPCGLGVVWIDRGKRTERSEFLGHGTNNIAELMAVRRAVEAIDDVHRPIAVHTDSQYAIGVLTKGWKAKANGTLIEELRDILRERAHVRFVHVRGHAGVPLNERADQLARESVETRKTVEKVVHDPATARRSTGHA